MKSYWTVISQGVALAIVLKKLARVLDVRFVGLEFEDVSMDGKTSEKADFFIEHPDAASYDGLVIEMLGVSARLAHGWSMGIEPDRLRASYSPAQDGQIPPITGLQSANWEILRSQAYARSKWRYGRKSFDSLKEMRKAHAT